MEETTQLKGTITRIIYRNADNGYTVCAVDTGDKGSAGDSQRVIGVLPLVREGGRYEFNGAFVTNKYGLNFKADSYMENLPTKTEDMVKYLGSGMVKGIGKAKAELIVNHFGDDALRIVDEEPSRLLEVKGIGKGNIKMIVDSLEEQRSIRSIMVFLKSYDLPNAIAKRIYKHYGDNAVAVLRENPYRLADEVDYIGFKKADDVARKMGFEEDCPFRVRSGIIYALRQAVDDGNTYLPEALLVEAATSGAVLSLPDESAVRAQVMLMIKEAKLASVDDGVYLPWIYKAERKIAARLVEIARDGGGERKAKINFAALERESGVTYNDQQREAVRLSATEGVLVLTGGPGTGKTVTTRAIIGGAEKMGRRLLLAAPTGRAAKRMTEVTGREACTIHRLLGYRNDHFEHDADNPLRGDILIVDESSMVDVPLMASLLDAVPQGMSVVLVGDIDQLPSVGCGNVLGDIIGSGAVATVRLTQIYRQAADSTIVRNAHRINAGRMPDLASSRDFGMYDTDSREMTRERLLALVRSYAEAGKELQVLTPMRRGGDPVGATELNRDIQAIVNPDGESLVRGMTTFRVGDRVMQMKNDYDNDVFNGDVGVVTSVDARERTMTVRFDEDKDVLYGSENIGSLELAYATTVHKSQGSEYPYVAVVMDPSHAIMLQRNLLYTAVTRARERCVIVGSRKAVGMAVSCVKARKRYSSLKEWIQSSAHIGKLF